MESVLVLCVGLFVNMFVLRIENERQKIKTQTKMA